MEIVYITSGEGGDRTRKTSLNVVAAYRAVVLPLNYLSKISGTLAKRVSLFSWRNIDKQAENTLTGIFPEIPHDIPHRIPHRIPYTFLTNS